MHGSRAENTSLIEELLQLGSAGWQAEMAVCPPFVYLQDVARLLKDSGVALGAQDVCAEASGAFTGEVAASMLKDVGCHYAIVGHSERRALYAEDDRLVARKFLAAQGQQLVPILCVGETLAEREAGQTQAVVARQLDAVLAMIEPAALKGAVLAYEPVWAIGTGKTATPEQAQEVHAYLRGRIAARDARIAADLKILYGGSVKASNAAELFGMPDVDGGLVGGASLKAEEFARICGAG
jgi:triosephosphate isomerase